MASINTYNNTYPYQGIKLVKVSKIDKEGKDITYRLLNLQTLTLSLGSSFQTYEITQRQEFDTYFLFNIDNENYDTSYTGSRVEEIYKRHDYGFSISRADTNYNPVDKFLQPTPNKYVNAFGNNSSIGDYANYPVTILIDSNGPDNESYFGKYLGIDQPQKLFFWSNTPSVPMKYTTSIRVTSTKRYEFTVAMIKASNTSDSNGSGLINQSADTNIIPSIVTVTNPSNFSDLTPEDQATISDSPLTIDIGPPINSKIIQLEGVTDVHQGQYTTVIFKFNTTDDDPVWDPSAVSIESLNFTINPYYEIEEDGTMATFPQEGNTSLLSTQPNLFIEDTANLDVYEFSDYNPTLNNAFITKKSQFIQKSIRDKNSLEPSNLPLILNGLAEPSDVSDYNYELNASKNARYKGAKNTSLDFNLNSKRGLGLPPAEQNTSIFLNCLGAGGQSPEYRDATAFFFNKVIDENLEVYPSTDEGFPQFIDLKLAFGPGTLVDVNIFPEDHNQIGYDTLRGTSKVLGIGTLQTLINTGYSADPNEFLSSSTAGGTGIEFIAAPGSVGQNVDDYRFNATLASDVLQSQLEGSFPFLNFDVINLYPTTDRGYDYSSTGGLPGRYVVNPVDDQAQTNATLKFKAAISITNLSQATDESGTGGGSGDFNPDTGIGEETTGANAVPQDVTVQIVKNGNEVIGAQTLGVYTLNGTTQFEVESEATNYADEDKIVVLVKIPSSSPATANLIRINAGSGLTTTQEPSPQVIVDGSDDPASPNWITPVADFGESNYVATPTSILALHPSLYEISTQNMIQKLTPAQSGFGYTQNIIVRPQIQPGDEIRFSFNEDQAFKIIQVKNLTVGSNTRTYIQINGTVQNMGVQRNHFLIRRFNGDNKQLTTNVPKYFSGGGSTTASTIAPIHLSEKLKNNFSRIVRNLTDEGVL